MNDIKQIDILYTLQDMSNPSAWVQDDDESWLFIASTDIPPWDVAKVAFELAKAAYLEEPKNAE